MPLGTPRAQLCAQEPPRPSWHCSSLRRPAFPGTPVRSGRVHCTLATQASPTQLPLPPGPGRSSSPEIFPLCKFSFLRQCQGMPLQNEVGGGNDTATIPLQLWTKAPSFQLPAAQVWLQ